MLKLKRKKKGRDKEMHNKLKEGSNEDKQRNNEIKTKQGGAKPPFSFSLSQLLAVLIQYQPRFFC